MEQNTQNPTPIEKDFNDYTEGFEQDAGTQEMITGVGKSKVKFIEIKGQQLTR